MKIMTALAGIGSRLAKSIGKSRPHISDDIARDIGMTPADLERHRFVWPSQSLDRTRF